MSVNKYIEGKLVQLSGNADTRLTTEDIANILGFTPADPSNIEETYTAKVDFDELTENLTALTEAECDSIVSGT